VYPLFAALDRLEDHLAKAATAEKPYLFGEHVTEADVLLYTALARFDVAYHGIFRCNLKMVRHDYPNLHLWLRRLYWDRDEKGPLRAAFHRSTQPWIDLYATGYARGKMIKVPGGPLIVPRGPAVLVEELRPGEEIATRS
jgi:putative glutathione S-transferase